MTYQDPRREFSVVKFVAPVVVGGFTVSEVENKERHAWSFELDFPRRVVWVARELANKQFSRGFVPFENVLWVACAPRS